ncbi:MAG TPA: DUF5134 domain-containing protein [Mycobacteriales bacterium]|nr:DUF5134 domain-containing protein [Mycobacteriales bacterium]
MITSTALRLILTALSVAAGLVHLTWSAHRLRPIPHRTSDLAHAVMAAGMIAMCWTWGMQLARRPQELVFGLATAWFGLAAFRRSWCRHDVARPWAVAGYHAVTMAGMVWMLASMTELMPIAGRAGGAGMSMPGMSMPGAGGGAHGHPWPVLAVGYGLVAFFAIGAWWWIARALDTVRLGDRPGDSAAESAAHGAMSVTMAVMIAVLL